MPGSSSSKTLPQPTTPNGHRVDFGALWRPAAIFLASRVVVWATFAAVAAHKHVGVRSLLLRWDGGFYLGIARQGYPHVIPTRGGSRLAFFPAFPVIVRALTRVSRIEDYWVAVFVTLLAGLVAACLLWLLTRELANAATADRATALLVFAPGSFVLTMLYAEGVLLVAAIACCWALIRRQYVLAGLFGAVASATRPNGLALVFAAAWAAYFAWRDRREWRAVVAVPLAASGFVAVQLFLWRHTGVTDAWFRAERNGWHEHFSLSGRVTEFRSVVQWLDGTRRVIDWNRTAAALGLLLFVVLFVLLLRAKLPGELAVYAAGIAFFALTSATLGFRPRFVMTAFPLAMGLAVWLRNRFAFGAVIAVSTFLLVIASYASVNGLRLTP